MRETAEQIAERFVAAFVGDNVTTTVQRDRLVGMVRNAVIESQLYNGEPEERITIEHVEGNTLTGTVQQVLSTHLAPGWKMQGVEMIECPHWSPGRITLRRGCTACAAEAAR